MSWSSRKKKKGIFCTVYLCFISMCSLLNTLSEYKYFYKSKKHYFIHFRRLFLKLIYLFIRLKNTHREKVPSIKTPALRKSTNTGVWAVRTLNQLFMRFLNWNKTFKKNKVVTGKTPFSVIGSSWSYHSICLNIGFWYGSFCMEMMPFQS